MRKLGILVAIVAVLAAGLVSGRGVRAVFAAGPTCNVPSVAYATIQSAVNDPTCSTILVAAGVYPENLTIGRALTLDGAKHGVDARTRTAPANESTISGAAGTLITINASNVTVDGFRLLGPFTSGAAFAMPGGNSGEMIENNVVQSPLKVASFSTSSTTFRRNAIHETSATENGIEENTTAANDVTIADNSFDGTPDAVNYPADVTIISSFAGTLPLSQRVAVDGNTSTTGGTLVALFQTNTAEVKNNTSTGANASVVYIGGNVNNIVVSGNHISGDSASAIKVANAFGDGPNSNVTITGNTLSGNGYGVNVAAGSVSSANTVQIHQNNLSGNTSFGVNNATSFVVDAGCNWWGSASGPGPVGPGSGDRVSTLVTFAPWLTAPAPNGLCIGGKIAMTKNDCKDGGWKTHVREDGTTFENQGECVSYITGHEGR